MRKQLRDLGPYLAQPVNAGNSANGAPRRGWIVYAVAGEYAHVVAFLDEGFEGNAPVVRFRKEYGALAVSGIVLPIPVREYNRMVREWAI